ncbi:MAG: archaeal flagellin FlaB [Thermoplasmata archaeon]|nr:archaeal flagellin FlaB [Thermoplasmata archaeon]
MHSQRQPKNTRKTDERAEVGIGTMIVFISTILVAAIAAGVLINTSQKLQQKAAQTGNEAVANTASTMMVLGSDGSRNGATGDLQQMDVRLALAAGADPVDVSKLILVYSDGQTILTMGYGAAVADDTFTADWIRDSDSSGANQVMTGDDLVVVHLGEAAAVPTYDLALAPNTHVQVTLEPSHGSQVKFGFTSPDSFTDKKQLELF